MCAVRVVYILRFSHYNNKQNKKQKQKQTNNKSMRREPENVDHPHSTLKF